MKMNNARSGYILITTIMMLTTGVAIVTYLMMRGSSYVPFVDSIIKREKARALAFGGLHVAMGFLATPAQQKDAKSESVQPAQAQPGQKMVPGQKGGSGDDAKQLAMRILPALNRWQRVSLQAPIDGVDGTISYAISCEDGKINLNQIYDFEKKQFRGHKQKTGNWETILKTMCDQIDKHMGSKQLFENVKKALQKQMSPFDDPTQLLTIPGFIIFNDAIFYEPPQVGSDKGAKKEGRPLYLTDIFTIYTQKYTIDPWVFSDSLAGLLGLKRAESGDREQREKMVETVMKKFKKNAAWKTDWKQLVQPFYVQEFKSLPKDIESVLETTFDPTTFSIIVHATIDSVTQRLCAIVERIKLQTQQKSTNKKDTNKAQYDVQIRKIYWL